MTLRSGVLAFATLLAGVQGAAADTNRISRGEAEMILKGDGVGTIVGHGGTPAVDSGFGIRPYFDPASYCVLDWHVLIEGWFDLAIEKPNADCDRCLQRAYVDPVYYSVADLRAAIEAVVFTLELDGVPLDLPIQPMTAPPDFLAADFEAFLEGECQKYECDFNVLGAYGRNAGVVLYGGDIGLGEHTLSGTTTLPDGTTYPSETTFTIEGPDSAVCNAPR